MDDTTEATGSTGSTSPTESIQPKATNKLTLLMRLHWKGLLPLVISYWVVGWLLQAVVVLGALSGAAFLGRRLATAWSGCGSVVFFLPFSWCGTWWVSGVQPQPMSRPPAALGGRWLNSASSLASSGCCTRFSRPFAERAAGLPSLRIKPGMTNKP